MTTCDSPWVLVGIVTALAGGVGGAILYAARRAQGAQGYERPWLAISAGVSLVAGGLLLRLSWGAGFASLLAFAFLPSLLGSAFALPRPDASRTRAAFLAAAVTCAVLAAIVLGLVADAVVSAPCPGTEIGTS